MSTAAARFPIRPDRDSWPSMKRRLAAVIKTRSRDEWCGLLEGTDACFRRRYLGPDEAPQHPHIRERKDVHRARWASSNRLPAPRFSRTVPTVTGPAGPGPGQHTDEALSDWAFSGEDIARLRAAEAIR